MKWYKDGSQFLSGDSDPGTLRLDLVVVEDTGIYECRVINAYGNDSVNSTLSVYGELVLVNSSFNSLRGKPVYNILNDKMYAYIIID